MALFSVNDEGDFELSEESKWARDNHEFRSLSEKEVRLIRGAANGNGENDTLWARNACDAYFKLKDFFKAWTGVSVEMVAFEIGDSEQKYTHSLYVYARGVRTVDICAGSVLAECISLSSGFQISDGKSLDFDGFRIIFDRDAGTSHRLAMDEEALFDESVDEFDKMRMLDSFGETFEEFPDLDAFFEEGSLFSSVIEDVNKWCLDNGYSMPLPYENMIGSLCKLMGHMVVNDIDCPPELAVLFNDGGIRINLKCSFVDPIDVELYLPIILKIVSNMHFEWGIEDGSDNEEFYNKYDISLDIPIKWQRG